MGMENFEAYENIVLRSLVIFSDKGSISERTITYTENKSRYVTRVKQENEEKNH